MKYKSEVLTMMDSDYEAFCKALFSIELDVNNQEELALLYARYMRGDNISLLNENLVVKE
ncbi:hypothetical protein [Veillonella intestinalis]|uniref:hypothetical protein n=1 Tax=Veillonella intestinalis TaxID=2941341 RepID=UPI00203FF608|nr:hypothetical protein [Veillonella intestinalis]